MNFIKKQSIGFYLSIITIIMAIVGLSLYFSVDPNFSFFLDITQRGLIITCAIIALIVEVAYVIFAEVTSNRDINGNLKMFISLTTQIVVAALLGTMIMSMVLSGVFEMGMALGSPLGDHDTANYFLSVIIVNAITLILCMATAFFKVVRKEN